MNDFTKEELQYLHSAIYERPSCITQQMNSMRDKIQSLIENYECEHFGIIKLNDNFHPISNEQCLFCHKPMD